jgi:hypothetical protein
LVRFALSNEKGAINMKRLGLISVLAVPLMLLGFFVSCDNAGGLSGYYVYAEFDGTPYEWKLGLTNIVDDAFGLVTTMSPPDSTLFFATPDIETGASEPDNYMWIEFEDTTIGTYSISDMDRASYIFEGVEWMFTDITLVVTTFEGVGGVITGTFSGTVTNNGSTMTVENGQFNVIRVSDNSSPS